MPRRRESQLGKMLESYGVSSSGGHIGVLSHLLDKDGTPTPEYYESRALQRIGTRDPKSRAKFDRRSRRFEARLLNEHAFIHGQRFREPEFRASYDSPGNGGKDGISEVERTYGKDVLGGRPLSIVIEDLRAFRKTDKAFAKHFSREEVDHIARHLTIKALRNAKLGAA